MMRKAIVVVACMIFALLGVLALGERVARAADETQTDNQIAAINRSLAQAGAFYRDKKTQDAASTLQEARTALVALKSAKLAQDAAKQVKQLESRLDSAERLVQRAQAATPSADSVLPEEDTASKKPSPAAAKSPAKPATGTPAAKPAATPSTKSAPTSSTAGKKPPSAPKPRGRKASAGPSFTHDVAPILIAKCGQCHVKNARGELSMANFAALEKGGKTGPLFQAGDSEASLLTAVIFSGKMPKGSNRVSPEELQTIAAWIDAGARFDGGLRDGPLGNDSKKPDPLTMVENLTKSTGNESVQFDRDLAVVIVNQCSSCHGGDQPAGQLRMDTFADLLKGGVTGKAVEPEKPGESLLVQKLRGDEGERMPLGKPPLPDETIAKIETWIKEGAHYDGADPGRTFKLIVSDNAAARMSHEELHAQRAANSLKIWALGAPDDRPAQTETPHFILVGNVSEDRLTELGELAEAEWTKIIKWLKLRPEAPVTKGKLVLFFFKRPFDYTEFVRMVEKRELPRGTPAHWHFKGLDAYACIQATSDSDANLPALLAEQAAGAYFEAFKAPSWFSVGTGRAVAARVEPKCAIVKQWDETLSVPPTTADENLLNSKLIEGETSDRCYSFAKYLMTGTTRFQTLVASLAEGHDFSASLSQAYNNDARALFEMWLRRPVPRKR